jgi:hypothetical protein
MILRNPGFDKIGTHPNTKLEGGAWNSRKTTKNARKSRLKRHSKIAGDALHFPIAVTRGIEPAAAADLFRRLCRPRGAARLGFRRKAGEAGSGLACLRSQMKDRT